MKHPIFHGRPLDLKHGRIDLTHGAGGRASAQLVNDVFAPAFDNAWLAQGNDQAIMPPVAGRLAMSTDCHVVAPLFFPGGDIGVLAVNGTVNDLAVGGAQPRYLSAGFILEEGLPLDDLVRIVQSMARAARDAGVQIVTGDTKVVERGKADGLFITTAGVGVVPQGVELDGGNARPGDAILLSGHLAEHGLAVLSQRENIGFDSSIVSDCAALNGLTEQLLETCPSLRLMRDPTRGGLGNALNEICQQSGFSMRIWEEALPIRTTVRAACEFFGLDPLYIANEGKLIAVCARQDAPALVDAMRAHPLGQDAALIGEVTDDARGLVRMQTSFGGERLVDWLNGEVLPRIC
ncbi:carbamoyl phosphate phosphatase, hydrogenase 3 maturation protein [Paraburkholderia piptadeniae]|nr:MULTISPECIES: hydrogenase expression/formation protein HypE [Paraburkholderia]SIT52192.1 carbamoyl phosphate phosphatase, hydrogenase 3 maturation protein [Paraburkholderia piptadeniae]